jgi:hypothetical protein
VLIADPISADTVFHIRIAWPATGGSIAIMGVAPSYSGGGVYADAPVSYAPPAPWVYDGWSYDPWLYGDYYGGYSYGPYCPFLTVFPFISFYGFDHHRRPSPPYIHYFPPRHPAPVYWSSSRDRYSHYVPPWHPDREARTPLLPPRRSHSVSWADRSSGPLRSPAATRVHPVPDFRRAPSASLVPHPRNSYSDQRRAPDFAMARPQPPSSASYRRLSPRRSLGIGIQTAVGRRIPPQLVRLRQPPLTGLPRHGMPLREVSEPRNRIIVPRLTIHPGAQIRLAVHRRPETRSGNMQLLSILLRRPHGRIPRRGANIRRPPGIVPRQRGPIHRQPGKARRPRGVTRHRRHGNRHRHPRTHRHHPLPIQAAIPDRDRLTGSVKRERCRWMQGGIATSAPASAAGSRRLPCDLPNSHRRPVAARRGPPMALAPAGQADG